jgi:V/A-type H+-transporting ATPase subunit A
VGERLAPGAVFGSAVSAAAPGRIHRCLVPPDTEGEVVRVAPPGEYDEDVPLVTLETSDGRTRPVAMRHRWPVRTARPAAQRLGADEPLLTGQRIVDSLFPSPGAVAPRSPAALAPARPSCWRPWPIGAAPM